MFLYQGCQVPLQLHTCTAVGFFMVMFFFLKTHWHTISVFKEALSINALRTCVYVYIQQLSSFSVPMLWFINLTVATCYIHFSDFMPIFLRKWTKHENTRSLPFSYDWLKMAASSNVIRHAKQTVILIERASNYERIISAEYSRSSHVLTELVLTTFKHMQWS